MSVLITVLGLATAGVLLWVTSTRRTMKWRGIWLVVLAIWVAASVPIMWMYDSPYVTFEAATIRCGHQPVVTTNFMAGHRYMLPGDSNYGPSIFNDQTYYCSAQDAEAAHYRR